MKLLKLIYRIYEVRGEMEELKSFLINKGYFLEPTKFSMEEGYDKNSAEPALKILPKDKPDTPVGIIKESQSQLIVLTRDIPGRDLERALKPIKKP